ncbi:hypothetical protein [Streptomyces physcomitrii]|uniref:Uncharacterized protein n=1 Tax=Streptomyces physcomitrii TaxID=2724184 RepID=A0ABX1HAF7_9ACTN|nr:hypothetical protein [Streptomyces physcomitrii]NKI45387.1 hypothetical protein [Streptomyces physcomitrii]
MSVLRFWLKSAAVGGAAAALLATGPAASAAPPPPTPDEDVLLVGTWTGHRERIASNDGYRQGRATLVVVEQRGRTFKGLMRWSTPEGEEQDELVGAFSPDARVMSGADEEGTYTFKLVGPTTLDYCYAEHGEGYRTTCARLERKD